MLKFLRKKGVAKKVLWAIAIIIIISFSFFGIQGIMTGTAGYAGKIFGKNVSLTEFDRVYRDINIQAIMRYGDNYENIRSFLDLESQTWDRLILLHEAKKRKIKVTNEEVIAAIEKYPFFQRNNQFDTLLYNDILRYVFKTKARDFEESIRDTLKFNKIFEQETTGIAISESDLFAAYKEKNEKVQISYAFIPFESYKAEVSVTDEEARQYYTDHKLDFLSPEAINVEYIEIRFPEAVDNDSVEKTRKEAESVYKELSSNPNMREVAQLHNYQVQTTGFFNAEEPNLALGWSFDLLSKIFQLKPNEISGPFATSQGYQILQIIERQNSRVPDYEEIKDKATDIVKQSKASEIARQKSSEYLAQIKAELAKTNLDNFADAVKSIGLTVEQTPLFNRGQYLPKLGIAKDFEDVAFQLTETNKISDVVQTSNGFCILHLDLYEPADQTAFEKEKQTLSNDLLTNRRAESFNTFLNNIRLKAKLVSFLPKGEAAAQ